MQNATHHTPVLIIGAGISGLWLLNRLHALGISALLIEKEAVGCGQTIASQGIIHGGTKYALKGKLSASATNASLMTERWHNCFLNQGELDLSQVNFLSDRHYMWMKSSLSGLKSLVSSKVLNSNNEILKKKQYPEVFKSPQFTGHLSALYEKVLDIPSLLNVLYSPVQDKVLKSEKTELNFDSSGNIKSVTLNEKGQTILVSAEQYVFCAGIGNASFFKSILKKKIMQTRPLKMTWVKFHQSPPPSIYAHIIESGSTPSLTITTHKDNDGKTIWYLGGELAERGVNRTDAEQTSFAKNELNRLLPWVSTEHSSFHPYFIERAENENGGKRPSTPNITQHKNALICWPTKLTLTPQLSEMILSRLSIDKLKSPNINSDFKWPNAPLSQPIWDSNNSD